MFTMQVMLKEWHELKIDDSVLTVLVKHVSLLLFAWILYLSYRVLIQGQQEILL